MIERYNYRIDKDKAFFAGYLLCTMKGDCHQPSLFRSLRIIRVLEGSAVLRIDKTEYNLCPGDIVTLNNLVPRQFVKIYSPEFRFEVFAFSPLILKRENVGMSLFYGLPNSFCPVISKDLSGVSDLHMLLDVLKNKFSRLTDSGFKHEVISSLVIAVVMCITDIISANGDEIKFCSNAASSTAKLVSEAIEYIFSNISEPVTASCVAKRVNVSREYFSRVFTKFVGYSPANFINHCKTDNVIHLVKYNNMKILDAALESGFKSASGFYSAFRSVHGMSPRQFFDKNKGSL